MKIPSLVLIACATIAPGCGALPGAATAPTLVSAVSSDQLPLRLPTQVFVPDKAGIADIYLTDLPADTLTGSVDLSQATGTIVHIHVFTLPSAGDTPIATTATTATVRIAILAKGQAGIYAGGGFFNTSDDDAQGKTFSGRVRQATLYLRHATDGFDDLLGPSRFSTSINASRNDQLATTLRDALDAITSAAKVVE